MNTPLQADPARLSSSDRERRRIARRRAGARLGFLVHLTVYVAVNLGLIAIDLLSTPRVHGAQ